MSQFTNREASIYVFALQYALPRETGALLFVAQEIARNAQRFSDRDKKAILRDLEDFPDRMENAIIKAAFTPKTDAGTHKDK